MKTITPNIAVPTTNPTALVMLKMELWNNRSGSMGSVARPSQKMKTISSNAAVARRPTIVANPHG